ncbi:MAG: vibriolysin, partial [Micromonosporaceae bacterium]|nr:vibriolysin [Micromonosporaceae bacterium]
MRISALVTTTVLAVAASTVVAVPASAVSLDSDHDGMTNAWELVHHLNPHQAADARTDLDHDGLTNLWEFRLGEDPRRVDTDHDGIPDGGEDNDHDGL